MHSQNVSLSDTSGIKNKVIVKIKFKTDFVKENLTCTKLSMEITHLNTDFIPYHQHYYNTYQMCL